MIGEGGSLGVIGEIRVRRGSIAEIDVAREMGGLAYAGYGRDKKERIMWAVRSMLPPVTPGCELAEVEWDYDYMNQAILWRMTERRVVPETSASPAELAKPAPEVPRRRRVILRPTS